MTKEQLEAIKSHFNYCIEEGLTIGEQEENLLNTVFEELEKHIK